MPPAHLSRRRLLLAGAGLTDDRDIVQFEAAAEAAFASLYEALAEKLTSGLQPFAALLGDHHTQHAAMFNSLLPTDVQVGDDGDRSVLEMFQERIDAAVDDTTALTVAIDIERAAVATHLRSVTALSNAFEAAATATILPVEAQHAAVIAMLLAQPLDVQSVVAETTEAALGPAGGQP